MLNGQKSLSGSSTRSPYRPFLEWGFAIGVATLRLAGIYPLPIKECGNRSAILNVIGVVWSVMVAACTGLATVFYFTLEGSPESIPDVVTYIYFSCCIAITRFGNVYLMLCSRAIALRLIHVHYLARPYATESDERVILFVMFFAFFFLVLRVGVDVIVYKSWLMDGYVSIQSMYGNGGFALTVTPMIIIILDQINYYVTFLLPVFYSVCMVYLGRVFRELGTVLRQFVNLAEGSVTFLQCQLKGHLELAEAVKRLHHILSPYLFLVFALHLTEIFSFVGRIAGKSFFWGTLLLDFCCAACVLAVLISALLYADSQINSVEDSLMEFIAAERDQSKKFMVFLDLYHLNKTRFSFSLAGVIHVDRTLVFTTIGFLVSYTAVIMEFADRENERRSHSVRPQLNETNLFGLHVDRTDSRL